MVKKTFLILLLLLIGHATGLRSVSALTSDPGDPDSFEIPGIRPGETVIIHTGYTVSYNHQYMQANWVAYELTREETHPVVKRSNKFVPDPMVKEGSATNQDYKNSGYDKGHLAPAADMSWSAVTMQESFYFSNISPQVPGFNRGIWKKLEEKVRDWAIEYGAVSIVTGPLLSPGLHAIGVHQVAVPASFYKIIVDVASPGQKGIGFIMPNEGSDKPLQQCVVSIDSIEKVTGIDFFPRLSEEQERSIEGRTDIKKWSWNNGFSSRTTSSYSESISRVVTFRYSVPARSGAR